MYQLIKINFLIWLFSTTMAAYNDWTSELIDIEGISENPDLLSLELEATRIDRDDYRVSGTVVLNYELTDENVFEGVVFRSATGSNDYKQTPFRLPKCSLSKVMNEYYKPFLMSTLKKCAPEAPQFEGTFQPPVTPRRIVATNCLTDKRKFPPIVQPGFYRIVGNVTGQVDASIVIVVKVTKRIF